MQLPTLEQVRRFVESHPLMEKVRERDTIDQCGDHARVFRDALLARGFPAIWVIADEAHMFCLIACQEGGVLLDTTANQYLDIGPEYLLGRVEEVLVRVRAVGTEHISYWQPPWKCMDMPILHLEGFDLSPLEQLCFDQVRAEGFQVKRSYTVQDFVDFVTHLVDLARTDPFGRHTINSDFHPLITAALERGMIQPEALAGVKGFSRPDLLSR